MSSKLPVPTFYRRDLKSISLQEDDDKSPNSSVNMELNKSKDKYAHISSKVKSHWSAAEKQRSGIKDFFERKTGTSSSANSSATTSPESFKPSSRRSLPLVQMPTDRIAIAIAQIKRNTRFYSFSDSAASSTSISSINEVQHEGQ